MLEKFLLIYGEFFVKAIPHDYFNLVIYKDLLLVIAQLRDQVRELLGDLAQCQDQPGHQNMGQGPSLVFWLLVAMVAFSAGLGILRIAWHARRDGFFVVDR